VQHLKKRGADVDLDALPLDDKASYEMMSQGQTVGVFQFEGQGMRDALRKLQPTAVEDLIALGALYRPGPMDNIPTYVDCKHGRRTPDMLHPSLEPVLKETYGVIIYQEQVMQIAQILSGYSLGEADLLRRAMGKKKKEEMDAQKVRFAKGAAAKGVDPDQAESIFELVAKFAGYGFNKSHAAAYALVSYQTAWLKANAPVEFFAASMSLDLSNTDRLAVFYQDARRFGVKVCSPDINRSGADFEVEEGEVLYALGAVRNVGLQAMEHVVQVRRAGGAFRDLFDFLERIDPKAVNKRAFENLVRAGAFDCLHPNRAQLVAAADLLMAHAASVAAERASAQVNLFGGDAGASRPRLPTVESWAESDQLDEELAAVGFYLSGHPLQSLMEVLRRRRTVLMAEATQLAMDGQEAFRMAGVVRRKQERPSKSGEKFAFITLSDPSGEYEVMFPPESLRKCREILEVGRAIVIRARAKGRDGEVRFFGDDAEPVDVTMAGAIGALRVHLAPDASHLQTLHRRLTAAGTDRGAEITLVAALSPPSEYRSCEVEVKLPGRFALDAALRAALKTSPGVLYLEDV
jgi:DNA polymerase-3 subunit alpha